MLFSCSQVIYVNWKEIGMKRKKMAKNHKSKNNLEVLPSGVRTPAPGVRTHGHRTHLEATASGRLDAQYLVSGRPDRMVTDLLRVLTRFLIPKPINKRPNFVLERIHILGEDREQGFGALEERQWGFRQRFCANRRP